MTDVESTDDTDSEGSGLIYTTSGGVDESFFSINSANGELSFKSAPDFENPLDSGGDNGYDVQVTVTDTGELSDVQDIAVTVTGVNEAPDMQISKNDSGVSVVPGNTITYTLTFANVGNQDATGVVITEMVPANTNFNNSASTSGWSCVPDNGAGNTCTLAVGP